MDSRMLSVLFYIVLLTITIIFFLVACAVWLSTVLFDRDLVAFHWVCSLWTKVYFGTFPRWRRQVSGKENIRKGEAYMVIVNHRSMLDIPLMYALPFNFKWVSKKEVYKWPLFGWVLWMHGDIAIERGGLKSLRKMIADGKKYLDRGVSVIMFPEGTRGKAGELGRFHEGAFLLAKEAGVGVLPCVTTGTDTAFYGWKVNFRNRYNIRVLPPVSAEEVAATPPKELAAKMQQVMSAEWEELKADK